AEEFAGRVDGFFEGRLRQDRRDQVTNPSESKMRGQPPAGIQCRSTKDTGFPPPRERRTKARTKHLLSKHHIQSTFTTPKVTSTSRTRRSISVMLCSSSGRSVLLCR